MSALAVAILVVEGLAALYIELYAWMLRDCGEPGDDHHNYD